MKEENYIIYEVTHNHRTVYIGSGKPGRELHTMSGHSHNPELNKLFFTDPENMRVTVLREGLTKEESLEMEKEYIQATEPKFNKVHTNRHRKIKKQLINL